MVKTRRIGHEKILFLTEVYRFTTYVPRRAPSLIDDVNSSQLGEAGGTVAHFADLARSITRCEKHYWMRGTATRVALQRRVRLKSKTPRRS